jgi:arylsulfatase A-like enzyme/Flp pilus assembly protein TadD
MKKVNTWSRRGTALVALAIVVMGALFAKGSPNLYDSPAGGAGAKRLNLLLITIDTLRPDRLSCYGSRRLKTAAIDGLAAKGVLFSRAFAQATTTLPSHTNIMLGMDPLRHGVHDNANFRVGQEHVTLAEHLKANGYATGAFVGGFPLDSRFGLDQGFDVYDDMYESHGSRKQIYRERKASVVIEKALQWVGGRPSPWFLWVHCFDPHFPYEPPEPFLSRYKDRLYDGEVAYVDFALEPLLALLERREDEADTVVVLTGDHGESLGEHGEETHGYFAYNSTLSIPLIICGPGLKPGQVDQTVVHTDLFPTICDLMGIVGPPGLQGISLLPAAKGKKLPERTFYFESLYPYYSRGWAPLYGFLRSSEKFLDSPLPELYDIAKDFDELHNVVTAGTINTLKDKMARVIGDRSPLTRQDESGSVDSQTLEKLRSLGYISSPQASRKKVFRPEDDIKSFLPFHNKVVKAQDLYEGGKQEEGIALMRSVLTERPDLDITYSTLAQIYAREGKIADALAVMKRGVEALPSNLKIVSGYIHFLNEAGKYDDVISMLTADGRYPFKQSPESWNDLGFAYMNKGELDKALEALREAVSRDDSNFIIYRNLGDLFFAYFQRDKDAGAYATALEYYRKAIEINPVDPSSYNGLGYAFLQGGQPGDAIPLFEKALALFPEYISALYNLGLASFRAGKYEKALDNLVRFKERYRQLLPPAQAEALDTMIGQCRSRIR